MLKRRIVQFLIFIIILFFISCTKEYSYERTEDQVLQQTPAQGTLGNNNQCNTAVVSGETLTNVDLDESNTIQIDVNVTQAGYYTITTDTVNGIYFSNKGIFKKPGTYNINLQGHGTPAIVSNSSFTITFNNNTCRFSLPVLTDLNTWSFWDNNRKYSGIITGASIFPLFDISGNIMGQGLLLNGVNNISNPTPLSLFFDVEDATSFLQSSLHYIHNGAITNGFLFYENGILKYRINKTTINTFPLQIVAFNRITGIMEASFEGPVIDITTSPFGFLNIRRGRFNAQFNVDPRL